MSDKNHMAAFGDFGKWVPGFDFLKALAQPGGSQAVPPLGGWVAPTLSVEELDKRIQELKTVLFWLEQNATALKATVQAMEVQKMTLATLKNMNVSMQEMAQAFSIPTPAAAGAAKPAAGFAGLEVPPLKSSKPAARARKAARPQEEAPAPAPQAAGAVDPMQWWGALTQQFQTIADTALKDAKLRTPDLAGLKTAGDLAEQAGKAMAASAGQAGEMVQQALKTTQAWTGAAKKGGKAPAKAATRSSAAKRNAAPARKTSAGSTRTKRAR